MEVMLFFGSLVAFFPVPRRTWLFVVIDSNVNFDDVSSTQLALPAEMAGLGVSSASLLALPAFDE